MTLAKIMQLKLDITNWTVWDLYACICQYGGEDREYEISFKIERNKVFIYSPTRKRGEKNERNFIEATRKRR